jgi:hypothetical protein
VGHANPDASLPSLAASVRFRLRHRLLGSPPHDMRGPAGRVRADYVRQFIPNDRERSLLIDPVPIRERTALDVQVQHMIRLVDRIHTKEA